MKIFPSGAELAGRAVDRRERDSLQRSVDSVALRERVGRCVAWIDVVALREVAGAGGEFGRDEHDHERDDHARDCERRAVVRHGSRTSQHRGRQRGCEGEQRGDEKRRTKPARQCVADRRHHAVAGLAEVRVGSGATLVERHRGIGYLAPRRVGDEVAKIDRQRHLRAQRDRRIEHRGGRCPCRGTGAVVEARREHRRDDRQREHEARMTAAILTVAARMPGSSGGTAAGPSTPARSPNPTPHAANAAAAHAAVDAGRNPSATNPPASEIPPTATATRGDTLGTRLRTAIVPTGSVVTTSAPAIGDHPHTTTSKSTDRKSAPTKAPYSARKPAFATPAPARRSVRGARSTARTRGSMTAISASAASGAWSKKMLRQLNSSVRKPPSAGPSATPIVPASPHTRIACSSLPPIPTNTGIAPDERQRGTETLKCASDDQHLERRRQATRHRRHREHAQPDPRQNMPSHPLPERQNTDRTDNNRKVVRSDRPRNGDDRHVERSVQRRKSKNNNRRVRNRQRDRKRHHRDQQTVPAANNHPLKRTPPPTSRAPAPARARQERRQRRETGTNQSTANDSPTRRSGIPGSKTRDARSGTEPQTSRVALPSRIERLTWADRETVPLTGCL